MWLSQCGFIDDGNIGKDILGSFDQVLTSHPPERFDMALAIGYKNLDARWKVYKKVRDAGYLFPPLIHPRADLHGSVEVGDGCLVMAGALLDVNSCLESVSVLWPGVVISHDSIIGENTFVSPNATVCGFSSVGSHSFVGAGAVIPDHVKVPDRSFIRAGSLYCEK